MSITQQQHTRPLATILDELRAEHDETVRGLKAALANVVEERDAEKTRADQAEAAGVEMAATIADGIRREERLHAEARMYERVSLELQDALDAKHVELRNVSEMYAEQYTANRDLLAALDNAQRTRRLLRRRIQRH